MSKKLFTSDTHWGHANIIKYSIRPFKDVDEMNEALILNWNREVAPEDEVYHLGDFGFANADKLDKIITRLNGKKHLIWGNHDQTIMNNKELQKHFVWCRHYHELSIPMGDKYPLKIVMFHYPILEWNKGHHGAIHVHGHTHGNCAYPWKKVGPNGVVAAKILDVGSDVQNYRPITLERVIELVKDQPSIQHH